MGKSSKGKSTAPHGHSGKKKNVRLWQAFFALAVLGGLTWTYVVLYRPAAQDNPSRPENPSDSSVPSDEASLRNQLVLPATPRNPRPSTLDPGSFPDPQVAAAYQIAQAIPEVLESLPCYCGCYQSVGHRNNLDCFADTHGVT